MTRPNANPAGRRRRWFRVVAAAVSCALTIVLFELSVRVLVGQKLIRVPPPAPAPPAMWDPDHPVFGVWHNPGVSARLTTSVSTVTYDINSYGARDVERERNGPASRVVVLGDSVTEGWGVEAPQRLTNLLESGTGKPHLNFGMAHFGPYQSYLVYRDLAHGFAHDTVLLGIFPYNDFTDLDYANAAHAAGYEYRYRPYLTGSYPDYGHVDFRERDWQRFLRRHFYAYGALEKLLDGLQGYNRRGYLQTRGRDQQSGLKRSFYYDYTPHQLGLLKHCLELIHEQAGGRAFAVVLFPAPPDLVRYRQSGPSPLADELRAAVPSLRVVDLLPAMYEQTHPKRFFLSVERFDFHLNPLGNVFAAQVLRRELADLYRVQPSVTEN